MPKRKEPEKKLDPPPVFQNETEEADWWFANQDYILQMFKEGEREGKVSWGSVAKRGLTPTTTIRLDPADIALAKRQAEERGLKYQTYLKSIIHQALKREARRKPVAA